MKYFYSQDPYGKVDIQERYCALNKFKSGKGNGQVMAIAPHVDHHETQGVLNMAAASSTRVNAQ